MGKLDTIIENLEVALVDLVPRVESDSLVIKDVREDVRKKIDNELPPRKYKCLFCGVSLMELVLVFRRFVLIGHGNTHLACVDRVACAKRVIANAAAKAAATVSDEDRDDARRAKVESTVVLPGCES